MTLLVNFHQQPPRFLSHPDETENETTVKISYFKNGDEKKSHQHITTIESDKIVYRCDNYGESFARTPIKLINPRNLKFNTHYSYFIGVFDKKTQKVKIIPTSGIGIANQNVKTIKERAPDVNPLISVIWKSILDNSVNTSGIDKERSTSYACSRIRRS